MRTERREGERRGGEESIREGEREDRGERSMRYLTLSEVLSTNSYCREHFKELGLNICVRALSQPEGRGQRGNSWESEPGKNLTFSILWKPAGLAPREQFSISEATACGVVDYLESRGIEARVTWPNEIYVGDKKICGILIEHSLIGNEMDYSIIGVGINVNQHDFISDALNPVSMWQLTGKRYDLRQEMESVGEMIERNLEAIKDVEGRKDMHSRFLKKLWRGDGNGYRFRDVATGEEYMGVIKGIESDGFLNVLPSEGGDVRRYAFKEVEFIL
ncbi:MAG: biotin--[acetyl-CoA-carboxylase] ligase [Muribaculaceae bacterium]|nr:biotin--[acetyl-CoA-carboxylase] ligase [Muribaculaceae bacterium]